MQAVQRLAPATPVDEVVPLRDQVVDGAAVARLAEGDAAVHAAGALGREAPLVCGPVAHCGPPARRLPGVPGFLLTLVWSDSRTAQPCRPGSSQSRQRTDTSACGLRHRSVSLRIDVPIAYSERTVIRFLHAILPETIAAGDRAGPRPRTSGRRAMYQQRGCAYVRMLPPHCICRPKMLPTAIQW